MQHSVCVCDFFPAFPKILIFFLHSAVAVFIPTTKLSDATLNLEVLLWLKSAFPNWCLPDVLYYTSRNIQSGKYIGQRWHRFQDIFRECT